MSKQVESFVRNNIHIEYDDCYDQFDWWITLENGKQLEGALDATRDFYCDNDLEELTKLDYYIINEVEEYLREYTDNDGNYDY